MIDVNAEIESLKRQAEQFLQSGNENKYKVLMERVNQLKYSNMTDVQLMQLGYEELQEAKRAFENTEEFDINKYNIVVNAMAEKATEQPHIENAAPAYEFINKIDFDAYAGTGSNILNSIVQGLLNKVRSQSALQSAEKDAQLREKDEIIDGNEAQITNLTYQNKSLQETVSELSTYKLNNDDYKARFEATIARMNEMEQEHAQELQLKNNEIERYKRREFELQQQLANAPAPTVRQVIDITSEDEINALIEKAKKDKEAKRREEEAAKQAAKPKITNKRWEDEIRQQFYLAELVEDCDAGAAGTTIKFNRLNENLYRVVSAVEAERFRAEAAAASQTPIVESSPLVTEVPEIPVVEQFRTDEGEVRHDEGVDTSPVGEVAPEEYVTRQEFEEVKRFVAKLQFNQDRTVTWGENHV